MNLFSNKITRIASEFGDVEGSTKYTNTAFNKSTEVYLGTQVEDWL